MGQDTREWHNPFRGDHHSDDPKADLVEITTNQPPLHPTIPADAVVYVGRLDNEVIGVWPTITRANTDMVAFATRRGRPVTDFRLDLVPVYGDLDLATRHREQP